MGNESFSGVKRPGRGVNHPPSSKAEVKERVQLYLYSPLWVFIACYRVDFTILYNIRIIILCGNRSDRGIQT
jgi:hypothetical protein